MSLTKNYSYLPNKWGGPNKQGGWKLFWKSINGEGENVPNKRGGWKCSSNSINGEKKKMTKQYGFSQICFIKRF